MALSGLLPAGIERFILWNKRFQDLGFSHPQAIRAAASRTHKRAYLASRIEQVPAQLRTRLRFVVDVGANRGQWASALLTVAQPQRMELFEPNPEAFDIAQRTLGGRPGLRLHRLAVGAEPGELPLQIMNSSDFSSFLTPAKEAAQYYAADATAVTKRLQVKVDTLDNVLREVPEIDLLKIDVQGFERQVLAGATSTLKRTRALLIEANLVRHYERDDSFGRLTDLLEQLDFDVWDISPPFRSQSGRALWCDAVFCNRVLTPSA